MSARLVAWALALAAVWLLTAFGSHPLKAQFNGCSPGFCAAAPSAFTPASISGLAVWYDFSNAGSITLGGSNITQINDLSGNSNTAVQATGANQFVQCSSCQNSKNTATVAGSCSNSGETCPTTKLMTIANSSSMQIGTNMTAWAVMSFVSWTDGNHQTLLRKGANGNGLNYQIGKFSSGSTCNGGAGSANDLKFTWNGGSFEDTCETSGFHGTANQYYIILWLVDRSGTDTIIFRVNGSTKSSPACTASCAYPSNNTTGAAIGCNGASPVVECFNGAIAEMGLYNSLLTSTQYGNLETYADSKWGLGF